MLKDIGFHGMYSFYRELCEIIHIGPEMVIRFKQGLGSEADGRIRIAHHMFETEWVVPFLTIGWSVAAAAMVTLTEFGVDSPTLRKIDAAQVALATYVRAG